MSQKTIAVVGAGPASLFAACVLSEKYTVHLYEKEKTIGRKFLVAGNGGFNLTNRASGADLTAVYSDQPQLKKALENFDSQATRNWLLELGVETFVGSSGRIFPKKGIKPIEVLEKIKKKLADGNVTIHVKHEFIGFNADDQPFVQNEDKVIAVEADHYIFGLGGGSWKKTGANDRWLKYFEAIGIKTAAFEPSNCGLDIKWPPGFIENHEGKPLKNISISVNKGQAVKGEALITHYGIEGNAVYPIAAKVRGELNKGNTPLIHIDFKPNNTNEQLFQKAKNLSLKPKNYPFHFKLDKVSAAIIKMGLSKEAYFDPMAYAGKLKRATIKVEGLRPLDEAISTVGGILMNEVDADFSVRGKPSFSVIGEMLDWDAPTGGYLLQACFAMANSTAVHLMKKL